MQKASYRYFLILNNTYILCLCICVRVSKGQREIQCMSSIDSALNWWLCVPICDIYNKRIKSWGHTARHIYMYNTRASVLLTRNEIPDATQSATDSRFEGAIHTEGWGSFFKGQEEWKRQYVYWNRETWILRCKVETQWEREREKVLEPL